MNMKLLVSLVSVIVMLAIALAISISFNRNKSATIVTATFDTNISRLISTSSLDMDASATTSADFNCTSGLTPIVIIGLDGSHTSRCAQTIHEVQPVDNYPEYAGVISTSTDGQNTYTSRKYGLQFEYPRGWYVGDNHLGYGTFQLFNYDYWAEERGEVQLPKNGKYNKIEASIGTSDLYGTSQEYPESSRDTKIFEIAGQIATRDHIIFKYGSEALSYIIPIANQPGKFIAIVIYGDTSNFHVLDELVSTIKWLN